MSLRVSSGATAFSAQLKVFEWFISKAFAEILGALKAVKHKNEIKIIFKKYFRPCFSILFYIEFDNYYNSSLFFHFLKYPVPNSYPI